jgi:hypothetical protein
VGDEKKLAMKNAWAVPGVGINFSNMNDANDFIETAM